MLSLLSTRKKGKIMENSSKRTTNRWLIIFGTILIQVSAGSFYAWSIFNNGFMLKSGGVVQTVGGVKKIVGGLPAGSVSFTFTLGMLCLSLATLAGIPLAKKYGIKIIALCASVIYGLAILGLMMIGKGSSIWMLWLFGGVLLGAMNGVLYLTTLTNAIKWFPEKKGLISGISVASYGLGSFIFKYIDMAIAGGNGAITAENIDRVLLWWGILALILAGIGSFFLKDAPDNMAVPSSSDNANEVDKTNFKTSEMLHTSQAYLMFFCLTTAVMFMGLLGAAVTNMAAAGTQAPSEVSVWGGTSAAATFVAIVALANTIGRFIMGWLSDITGRKTVFLITFTIQLLALIALLLTKPGAMSMAMMYVVVIAMAFCFGGNITVFPTFVSDYFGLKNTSRNYSMIYQGFGIGAIIVGFLMASGNPLNPQRVVLSNGAVLTQNFNLTYWVLLIMVIISLVIFAFIKKPVKK
ncbi:oxalate formate antiporter [Lentilactobacillus diolivorans DSM 14421]|uniref:Oxalate formate antiporter n=2 Tax=Lentilactobacillus diolivorans TaxID=179838 RepID=A0A0R1SHH9_9LACO|nr:oxalate formate antiporter [Lentilactobacillus diolivorans DSM 14421]